MVLISQHCASPAVRALLKRSPPYVLLQRRARGHKDDYVGSDNASAMADAVAELVRLGHRRIGFIRGPAESSTAAERHAGFLAALRAHGLERNAALVYRGDYSVACGHRATLQFLQLPQPPTAIVASNDMNALGVLDAASERQVSVPERLSVVGYDNVLFSAIHRISLTTIDLPQREMGAAAAALLMERIASETPLPPRTLIFPGTLICRGSTGPASDGSAATHPDAATGRRTARKRETT
jgi:LacI family transcriptional regulator